MLLSSGSNNFCILLNSEPVIKTTKTLSKRNKAATLGFCDFFDCLH